MWFKDRVQETGENNPPCTNLEKIIECDQDYLQGYRNKVEFTIGREFVGIGK